jgi:hypothetical protein
MTSPDVAGEIVFLVCVETAEGASRQGFRRRLDTWKARACLERCWVIPAHTTARVVYDTLAEELDDRDRLLVSELDPEAVWFNLRAESRDVVRRPRLAERRAARA